MLCNCITIQMTTLGSKLNTSLMKGALVGAVGGLGIFLLTGEGSNPVGLGLGQFELTVPLAVATGVGLGVGSVSTDFLLPYIVPYISGGDSGLRQFDNMAIAPLAIGTLSFAFGSVFSPEVFDLNHSVFHQIAIGTASAMGGGYVATSYGWDNTSKITA